MPQLPSAPPPVSEPWVDIATLSKHLGFGKGVITRMAKSGQIPSFAMKNGKRTYLRFRISAVDAAMIASAPPGP